MSSGDVVKTAMRCSRPHLNDKNVHLLRRADGTLFCAAHGDVVRVLNVTRRGVVSLDGERLGYVVRNAERLYEGFNELGRCLFANADCKGTAVSLLARRTGQLRVGDVYRITGMPNATGGPWTVTG